jgi:integrase
MWTLEEGTITIQRGKGGKRRVVGLDQGIAELVARCIEAKKKRRIRSVLLFSTLEGNQIDSSYVRHLLTRLARRRGGVGGFFRVAQRKT